MQMYKSKSYNRLRTSNFKKGIVKIHKNVAHQQVDRNFLRIISVNNNSHFRLQRSYKSLKSVILAEYFAIRILY